MHLIVHTDGGARGNPGPAAVGVVIEKVTEGERHRKNIVSFGEVIGSETNNVAEYTAVIKALQKIIAMHHVEDAMVVDFYLDSLLVVNQLKGVFKIKEPHLKTLVFRVKELEQKVRGVVQYFSIPREQNREADLLVNQALDHSSIL